MKKILIGTKELSFTSTALTSVAFKKIFGGDILRTLEGLTIEGLTGSQALEAIDLVTELAFVMNKQAEGVKPRELMHLTEDDYYEWLDGFGYGDLFDATAISEILSVWTENLKTSVEAKNVNAPLQES